jgi:hypothetical protein
VWEAVNAEEEAAYWAEAGPATDLNAHLKINLEAPVGDDW